MITARIMVTGSRDWTDRTLIRMELVPWHTKCLMNPTLVHGGASGADTFAAEVAASLGWAIDEHKADWAKHGKAAGPIRNREMVACNIDHVLAFRLNRSRGTEHAVQYAKQRRIPVTSWIVDDNDYPNALREEWKPRAAAA